MTVKHKFPEREEIAKREIGHTHLTPGMARLLTALFLLTIVAVPLFQRDYVWPGVHFTHQPDSWWDRLFAANRTVLTAINQYEDSLHEQARLARAVRPWVQTILTRWLGVGNEQAYVGREGWLYYRPDVDYVTGPGFLAKNRSDPRRAIRQFHDQLTARGIQLIVMPVPVKPVIAPKFLAHDATAPVENPSYQQFFADLRAAGITVFDPTAVLLTNSPAFLETDTHWTPAAMQRVAEAVAEIIQLSPASPAGYQTTPVTVTNVGDIAAMLLVPALQSQTVTVDQILTRNNLPWRHDKQAPVLVLGDSFSNIYSLHAMGWGESAGFVEHLSYALQRPVDAIVRNDAGAFATREILSRELKRGRDRLAGKQAVVWQFAARELAGGDWRLFDMTLGEPQPSRFLTIAPGQQRTVTGIIDAITAAPKPGTVSYKDHIIALHLVDIESQEAVVFMRSMRDNVWTPAARWRAGMTVTVRLHSWAEREPQLGSINRNELPDEKLQLEEPVWGEIP